MIRPPLPIARPVHVRAMILPPLIIFPLCLSRLRLPNFIAFWNGRYYCYNYEVTICCAICNCCKQVLSFELLYNTLFVPEPDSSTCTCHGTKSDPVLNLIFQEIKESRFNTLFLEIRHTKWVWTFDFTHSKSATFTVNQLQSQYIHTYIHIHMVTKYNWRLS